MTSLTFTADINDRLSIAKFIRIYFFGGSIVENYFFFVSMTLLLVLIPGPDIGILTQNTVAYGKKTGYKTIFGLSVGLVCHTLAAVFGLSAIILQSALFFSIFKYVGVIYLIYIGVIGIWSSRKKKEPSSESRDSKFTNKSPYLQGFLTDLLNPKVAILFMTFFPQFLDTSGFKPFMQFLIMGLTYTVVTILWSLGYVTLIGYIRFWLEKPSVQRVIQGVTGLVLIGFGIKLALEKKP